MQSSREEKLIAWRNRVIGSAGFRRWAFKLPGLRGIARRRARAMFDINAGFVYTQIALAMVETGLVGRLAQGPVDADEAARFADLPVDGAARLLKAAAALELAQQLSDGRFMLGELGTALHADPGIAAMIAHHRHLYEDLRDPVALLRNGGGGGALARYWTYARAEDPAASGAGAVGAYSTLMASSQAMVAAQVVAAFDFGQHRRMLDVGGGEGVFAQTVRNANPHLEVALFDLPAVAARAQGLQTFGGNFFIDPLPHGFDLVSLVRIVHDHDDDAIMRLLRAVYEALPVRGRVLIAEPLAGTRGAERMGDAYFGLYLWAMGSGRPRSRSELYAMLASVGFINMREHTTALPLVTRVISAQRL